MLIKKIVVGSIFTNCYFISDGQELAVIDPGGDTDKIIKEIEILNLKLKYIICTHYHYDHVLSVLEVKNKLGGLVLVHEAEKNYIDFKPDKFLSDGDEIYIGKIKLKVIHTPGHSAGSISLLGGNYIFTGDTLFLDGYGRTDLAGGSDEKMAESLSLLEKIIKPGMKIYPGHG